MEVEKINKLRNAISDFKMKSTNGSLALGYLMNLVDTFGKIGLEMQPYSFSVYYEGNNLVYDRGSIKDIIDENHSLSVLELIHTFKNDIKIYE